MPAVLLDRAAAKRPARDIVVATRMPAPPKLGEYRTPFDAVGDLVAECAVEDADGKPCGWGCMGSREEVGKAVRQHHQMFHATETSVVLLNHARQ